jgi:hypothetical protein
VVAQEKRKTTKPRNAPAIRIFFMYAVFVFLTETTITVL